MKGFAHWFMVLLLVTIDSKRKRVTFSMFSTKQNNSLPTNHWNGAPIAHAQQLCMDHNCDSLSQNSAFVITREKYFMIIYLCHFLDLLILFPKYMSYSFFISVDLSQVLFFPFHIVPTTYHLCHNSFETLNCKIPRKGASQI